MGRHMGKEVNRSSMAVTDGCLSALKRLASLGHSFFDPVICTQECLEDWLAKPGLCCSTASRETDFPV